MGLLETLLTMSMIFWGVIFLYVLWLDRKVSSLRKVLHTLKEQGE
jgi:hypothetical protein